MTEIDQVDLIFSYRIKDGEEGNFETYLQKVIPVTEAREPYVLEYELFQQNDGTILQHERYENEDAIYRHLEVTAEGQKHWGQAIELISLMVIGDLSQRYWDEYDGPHVSRFRRFREIRR